MAVDAAALEEDAELALDIKAGGEMAGFAVQIKDVPLRVRDVRGTAVRTMVQLLNESDTVIFGQVR